MGGEASQQWVKALQPELGARGREGCQVCRGRRRAWWWGAGT